MSWQLSYSVTIINMLATVQKRIIILNVLRQPNVTLNLKLHSAVSAVTSGLGFREVYTRDGYVRSAPRAVPGQIRADTGADSW